MCEECSLRFFIIFVCPFPLIYVIFTSRVIHVRQLFSFQGQSRKKKFFYRNPPPRHILSSTRRKTFFMRVKFWTLLWLDSFYFKIPRVPLKIKWSGESEGGKALFIVMRMSCRVVNCLTKTIFQYFLSHLTYFLLLEGLHFLS